VCCYHTFPEYVAVHIYTIKPTNEHLQCHSKVSALNIRIKSDILLYCTINARPFSTWVENAELHKTLQCHSKVASGKALQCHSKVSALNTRIKSDILLYCTINARPFSTWVENAELHKTLQCHSKYNDKNTGM